MIVVQPSVNKEMILQNVETVLETKWLGMGPVTQKFEEALAKYWDVDPECVICTSSCTASLQLAFWLAKQDNRRNVATTPITFVSTNHAILYNNMNPFFYDVRPKTGLVDFESLEIMCDKHPIDVVTVVHIAGQPVDMDAVNEIATMHDCAVVEDCAHAMGSSYPNGRKVGNNDNISCFSFHAVKNLAIGDGGAIVLGGKWKQYSKVLRQVRWMGIDKDTFSRSGKTYSWDYDVPILGYKIHMNDIQAAIGLAQLEILDETNDIRRALAKRYRERLPKDTAAEYREDNGCNYHLFLSFFNDRNRVADLLRAKGISPGMHYRSNTRYPMYAMCCKDEDLPGARWYEEHELSLPMHANLTTDDVDLVCEIIAGAHDGL